MTFQWNFGENNYPPLATSSNNELYDLDKAVYKLLDFYSTILNSEFGPRWTSVTQELGLIHSNFPYLSDGYIIAQTIPYPIPALVKTTDFRFPLLSAHRENEKYTDQTDMHINVESDLFLTISFPPLTAPQYNRIYPFLSAMSKKILMATYLTKDAFYHNSENVLASAGISYMAPIGAKYGDLRSAEGGSDVTHYPSIQVHIQIAERDHYISSQYPAYTGTNLQDDMVDGYQPGNPIVDFSSNIVAPKISINSVSPTTSPIAGNKLIILSGSGFTDNNIVSVTLCGVPASKITYKTPNCIFLITNGSIPISNGDVVVTDNLGNQYTLTGVFSYD